MENALGILAFIGLMAGIVILGFALSCMLYALINLWVDRFP